MDTALTAIVVLVALAVFFFEWGMVRSITSTEKLQKQRIKERIETIRKTARGDGSGSVVRDDYHDKNTSFYRRATGWPGIPTLALWIEQAGWRIRLEKIMWLSVFLGAAAGIAAQYFLNKPLVAIGAGVVAALLPIFKLHRDKNKRLDSFDSKLPEALDIITRALRAGHPFNYSLQLVADELEGAIAEEFAVTFAELNFGVPTKVALENMVRRMPSQPLKSLVTAIVLQRETGGNLAELLGKISSVIRGGYRFQRKLDTLSAEGKLSAVVMSSVPLVLGLGLYGFAPDLVGELFTNPKGVSLLYDSAIMYTVGFLWVRRMVRIKV